MRFHTKRRSTYLDLRRQMTSQVFGPIALQVRYDVTAPQAFKDKESNYYLPDGNGRLLLHGHPNSSALENRKLLNLVKRASFDTKNLWISRAERLTS